MQGRKYIFFFLIVGCLCSLSCTEEVDLSIDGSENTLDILVVEATLTDELKRHRVNLSRMDTILDTQIDSVFNPFIPSLEIDRDLIRYEENATVTVNSSSGTNYVFNEMSPGVYESAIPFRAEGGESYTLNITTANGVQYNSEAMRIEGFSDIGQLYAERITNDAGVEGIGIFIDNVAMGGNTSNLRFAYDETYKIIAPFWDESAFRLTNYDPCALPVPTYDLEIVPRETEQRICYGNQLSNTIIQAENTSANGTGLQRFMVRFIDKADYIISHRYSIEVSQMVTGNLAFGFYDKLKNFSESGNIFSQVQPGFIEGNIRSNNGERNNVIGFFDVVSVSKSRLFFNFTDFFDGEPLPEYPVPCIVQSSPESHVSYCFTGMQGGGCPQSIIEAVNLDLISYFGTNDELAVGVCPGPYVYVAKPCGDCTVLGSNEVPEFWIE
jgi:hypothetical protein